MNATKYRNDDDHPIRKKLKSLPRIRTSEDFEERLRRRISSVGQRQEGDETKSVLWLPRRVPDYALSMVALVAASVVAYYALVQQESVPVDNEVQQVMPPEKDTHQPQSPVAAPSEERATEPASTQRIPDRVSQSSPRRESAPTIAPVAPSDREEAQRRMIEHRFLKEVGEGLSSSRNVSGLEKRETTRVAGFDVVTDSAALEDTLRVDSLRLRPSR